MYEILSESIYPLLLSGQPERYANKKGGPNYPNIESMV